MISPGLDPALLSRRFAKASKRLPSAAAGLLWLGFLLSACSLFTGENDRDDPPPADGSPIAFGNFREGTTWKYAIHWVRSGNCTGDRIRTIQLQKVVPENGSRLLVYKWSDVAGVPDSAEGSRPNCDSVDLGDRYDSVRLDSLSRYEIPDTVGDAKGYGDLRQMSFFQIKRIPTDTIAMALCGGAEGRLVGKVFVESRDRVAIIDTTACLNGSEDSLSYSRYVQDIGLLRKRWGYRDEGVLIDYTDIRLLEFDGRPVTGG